jgi:hypothetical protein
MEQMWNGIFSRDGNLSELGKISQDYDITHAILHFPMPRRAYAILALPRRVFTNIVLLLL